MVREGMWAVVNEPGGTAPQARLADPGVQLAGKTGSAQVRRVSRELREHGHFDSEKLPWEFRPHALFVAFAPYDAPRYAVSVVIEHGNAGAAAAAPVARDIMIDTLGRDPANRTHPPGADLAQGSMPGSMPMRGVSQGGASSGGASSGGASSGGAISGGASPGGIGPGGIGPGGIGPGGVGPGGVNRGAIVPASAVSSDADPFGAHSLGGVTGGTVPAGSGSFGSGSFGGGPAGARSLLPGPGAGKPQ